MDDAQAFGVQNTDFADEWNLTVDWTAKDSLLFRALLALLALALAACDKSSITVPTSAGAGQLTMESCTYETDEVEYAADCGTLYVPENRRNLESRLIALPVTRIEATGDDPGEPVLWLSGGPGSSNMRMAHVSGLINDHEIIMVGYRGVDGSVALDCPKVTAAWSGVGGDLLGHESLKKIGEAFFECAERLQREGVDLSGYNLPEVIEDMDSARIALGYDRVNLLSGSYGTRLAMFYASRYPNSIYRSVMYAVNTPGHFVFEPETIDEMIAVDAVLCAQHPQCSSRTGNLAESMRNVVHNMPSRWLFIPIDPGKVRMTTHFLLFHRRSAATAYDLYLAAEAGDPSGLALASVMYDFIWPAMNIWGEWASKGGTDYSISRDWLAEMDPPGSILGSPLSLAAGGQGQLGGAWPTSQIPAEFYQAPSSNAQTLLVSGNMDFSVPPRWAKEELLPLLTNGEQVILSEFGHTGDVWGLQPDAMLHLVKTFFDSGKVDDSLFSYQPMDFHVENGWPEQAKTYLAVAMGVLIAVVVLGGLLIWFVVRRLRRRSVTKPY